jgi:hypothetical protein
MQFVAADKHRTGFVRFQVLTAASMMFRAVFWVLLCLGLLIPDDGGSTHLWNVGRQLFYTAVQPRRQLWTEQVLLHRFLTRSSIMAKSDTSHFGKITHQINSRQWEQKVGWRRNVAMNLWPFTWCTRRLMAPRLLFKPCLSLNSRGFVVGWSGMIIFSVHWLYRTFSTFSSIYLYTKYHEGWNTCSNVTSTVASKEYEIIY